MSNITFTLKVESAGAKGGNFARISFNCTEIGFGNYTRGLNVTVFDETTGQVLRKENFGTYLLGNSQKFADLINNLPTGQIVALAVKGRCSSTSLSLSEFCPHFYEHLFYPL